MPLARRPFALLAAAALLFAAGCGSNKSKLVGKWKVDSFTGKDAEGFELFKSMGLFMTMEFGSDDTVKLGIDSTDPKMKELKAKDKDAGVATGKYKVSGDTLEFIDLNEKGAKGDKGSPFGKDNKAKMKFEGNDKLTLSGSDGSMTLTRMK